MTNYAHVMLCLARNPNATLREVADQVGITERATHRIVAELEREGVISRSRTGRRNHYEIRLDSPLRHPLERHCTIGQLLQILDGDGDPRE
jgi:DNA-binding IscR family transcriptional regulator